MKINLTTANVIVSIALALIVVTLYLARVISGPLAGVMVILALMVLAAMLGKILFQMFFRD